MVPQSWKNLYSEDNLYNQGLQFVMVRNKVNKKKKNNSSNNKSTDGGKDFVVSLSY